MDQGSTKKKILIFSPFGSWRVHGQLEVMVGLALRERGAEILIVGCDGLFRERCYVLAHSKAPDHDCQHCRQSGQEFFGSSSIPYVQLRSYLTPNDFAEADRLKKTEFPADLSAWMHDDVPLGAVAMRSISSLLRVNPRMHHLPVVQDSYRVYVRDAVLCRRGLDRVFESFAPSHLIVFNGYGNLHGTALYLAKQRGVKTLAHDKGLSEGTFIINSACESGNIPRQKEIADRWKDVPLKLPELERVNSFFASREVGKGMNYQMFYKFESSLPQAAKLLRLPAQARCFGFFSSSEYELPFYEACPALMRQLEFIDMLFAIYQNRDDFLIIRHHPMIGGPNGTRHDWDMMTRLYQQAIRAPKNVRVIMPHEKVNTYSVLPFLTASFIPASTVSMEALNLGIPTAALTGCVQSDVTTMQFSDIKKEELETIIERLMSHYNLFSAQDYRPMYRFVNSVFYRHPKTFKSFSVRNWFEPDIRISSLADLASGLDSEMDRVCDHVLKGEDLYASPSPDDMSSGITAEDDFFLEWHKKVRELHDKAKLVDGLSTDPAAVLVRVHLGGKGPNLAARNAERQRYTNIRLIDWNASNPDASSELQVALAAEEFEYLAFELPGIILDEAFMSSAISELEQSPQYNGIVKGWWMYGSSKMLEHRFLEEDIALKGFPAAAGFWHGYAPLASLVVRRTALNPLFSALWKLNKDDKELRRVLHAMPVLFDSVPSVVVPAADNAAVHETVHDLPLQKQNSPSLEDAVAMVRTQRYEEALVLLKNFEDSFSIMPLLWYVRAIAQFGIGQRDGALFSVNNLLSKVPDHEPSKELLRIIEQSRR